MGGIKVMNIFLRKKYEEFLFEDQFFGDISTLLDDFNEIFTGYILVKEDCVIAGISHVMDIFKMVDRNFKVLELNFRDGDFVSGGKILLKFEGIGGLILKCERLILNILQRMSGIATNTKKYVEKLEGTGIKLLDTRKTTPGFRYFEKEAVRIGGGYNHRMGLYDAAMIKDNHFRILGKDIKKIEKIRRNIPVTSKIEMECHSMEDVYKSLEIDVDIIMLDNFSPEEVLKAIKIVNGRREIEVSGGITLGNIEKYSLEGVNYISTSKVISEAKWIDISLEID